MGFFARLFMDPHQRQLRRPEDYRAPLDVEAIRAEVRGAVKDPESRDLMLSELADYGAAKPLTLARVVEDGYSLREATSRATDRALHELGVEATLGAELMTGFLIRRANQLADGIRPGAAAALGDAL